MNPVIHHVEICVRNTHETLDRLKRYGFKPYLRRNVPNFCKQMVARLNNIYFVISEKNASFRSTASWKGSIRAEPLTVLCPRCEDQTTDVMHVDTVFNIALHVKDVEAAVERIASFDSKSVIKPPTTVSDSHGYVTYAIVRSVCGNVIHTLINKDKYTGPFLPGYTALTHMVDIEDIPYPSSNNSYVTHIDHVTLATYSGKSESVIMWYESRFGMKKFNISREDKEDGLIIKGGVGLRLRAMEYWMCSESALTYPSKNQSSRSPNSMMLVVVESLPGQTNCNVETFLRDHRSPGVEHIALNTTNIVNSVTAMKSRLVKFRQPPSTYYFNLKEMPEIKEIEGLNFKKLEKLGILLDREMDPEVNEEQNAKPKFLMQIFALPIFTRKTFFIEIIERSGAKGLGAGNILALVRSIREEEKRKTAEEDRKKIENESIPPIMLSGSRMC